MIYIKDAISYNKPLTPDVQKTTTYIRDSIQQLTKTDETGNVIEYYKYNEKQYDNAEYIELLINQQSTDSVLLTEHDFQIFDTQEVQKIESNLLTDLDFKVFELEQRINELEGLKGRNKK